MNSLFKFPRRVRIHGGECGAVARALHHEAQKGALTQNEQSLISDECLLKRQAELEKASNSTFNERKQMSTKTTLKRIALVAASALGFGLMSVIPANADENAVTSITAGTVGGARVGQFTYLPFTLGDTAGGFADDDTVTISARFLADGGKPASSSATIDVYPNSDGSGSVDADDLSVDVVLDNDFATNPSVFRASSGIVSSSATSVTVPRAVRFTPDIAGTYKVLVWVDGASGTDGTLDAGEKSVTFTVTTSGAISSFTVTKASPGTPGDQTTGATAGALVKIVPKDSAGNIARLTADEFLTVSATNGSVYTAANAGTYSSAITSVAATAQRTDGSFYVNVAGDTDADATMVFTVSGGGAIPSSVSSTLSISSKKHTTTTLGAVTNEGTTGIGTDTLSAAASSSAVSDTIDIATDSSVTFNIDAAGSELVAIALVTDTDGAITGLPGGQYTMTTTSNASTASADASDAYFTMSGTFLVGQGYVLVLIDSAANITITADANARSATTYTINQDPVRAATGGTITLTATVTDEFGDEVAGVNTAWTVSGRNTRSTATNALTNSEGIASFTYTDSGTSTSPDTVSVNSGADTSTVYWTSATEVSTVLLTTPNTTSTGADEYPTDAEDITAGAAGATTGGVNVTATVKDANANVLQGVPVTFTVAGTGVAVRSDKVTVYTGATGTASSVVYGWVSGTYTVTATAGGVSDTAPVIFAQESATEVRSISATVSEGTITVIAKDRFGNTIAGVPLKATRVSGSGNFAGSSSATGTTDENGKAEFIVTGGTASVKVTFNDANASTYGQSDALKGLVDGSTATNIFTAYVAGTATTAEVGVGASFDAAGVNSVTVEANGADKAAASADAAADAAAEAIDAANAATDAANLAAEAADAATVAAEEARDAADAATAAVEELATQVATLMAALKAQITTLANTVAKIAKKVKA